MAADMLVVKFGRTEIDERTHDDSIALDLKHRSTLVSQDVHGEEDRFDVLFRFVFIHFRGHRIDDPMRSFLNTLHALLNI